MSEALGIRLTSGISDTALITRKWELGYIQSPPKRPENSCRTKSDEKCRKSLLTFFDDFLSFIALRDNCQNLLTLF